MTADADLTRRCIAGDRAAWSALLDRYADLIYGLAHRAGLDASAKADVFQDVSVLLWKGLPGLKKSESLVPWLATTTRRVAWRMKRRAKSRVARDAASARADVDPGAPPPAALEALEDEQAVRRGMAALSERCRRLLRALYFESGDGNYDGVAERLGIPRGSLGPTRRRCLGGLRRELLSMGFGDDVSDGGSRASTPTATPSPKAGRRS